MTIRLIAIVCALFLATPANAVEFSAAPLKTLPGPYPAQLIRVIDGDSAQMRVTVWLGQEITTIVRLVGLDTPELKARCVREKDLALAAKTRLEQLLGGKSIEIYNIQADKYGGRVLAQLRAGDQKDVAQTLIAENLARPYAGKKRGGWCDIAQIN